MNIFQCGRYRFNMEGSDAKPLVMGILNITHDSFSDGGRYVSLSSALKYAEEMIECGVDIIDIGAESSRPGADPVPLQEELDRLLPVVEALKDCGKPLSIDTYKPETMLATLNAGADMINDIYGFQSDQSKQVVKDFATCGLCIMHMQGIPKVMQNQPQYNDVVSDVYHFLKQQSDTLMALGIEKERITIDPGFGFGKTKENNLTLLKNLSVLKEKLGIPILAGLSRKTVIGQITGKPVDKRLAGNIAAALVAIENHAMILRVHDVSETVDAIKIWKATH